MDTNSFSKISYGLLLVFILTIPIDNYFPEIINIIVVSFGITSAINLALSGKWELDKVQLWIIIILVYTLLISLVILPITAFPSIHIVRVKTLLIFCIITFAFVSEIKTVNRLFGVLISVSITAVTASVLSFINLYIELSHAFHRAPSTYSLFVTDRSMGASIPYGSYGILLSISVPFLIVLFYKPVSIYKKKDIKHVLRILAAVALAVLAIGLYISQSRSTIISITSILFYLFTYTLYKNSDFILRNKRSIIIALIPILSVIIYLLNKIFTNLFSSRFDSVLKRLDQYIISLNIMIKNPLIGNGFGYFQSVYGSDVQTHNLWLYIGNSLGSITAILWILVFILVLKFMISTFLNDKTRTNLLYLITTCALIGGSIELALYPGFSDVPAMFVGLLTACVGLYNSD